MSNKQKCVTTINRRTRSAVWRQLIPPGAHLCAQTFYTASTRSTRCHNIFLSSFSSITPSLSPPSFATAAPVSTDIDFDFLGQFELGAAGIAAAVLRGAAAASLRQQTAGLAAASDVSITQKDLEDAARAQLRVTESEISKYLNAAYT